MKFLICHFLVLATGALSVKIKPRICGGINAKPADFRFTVRIETKKNYKNNKGGLCGGSVIHNNWILTAAHCFQDVTIARVFLSFNMNYVYTKVVYATEIITHESFIHNETHLMYDIALVRIPTIVYGKYIQSIQLSHELRLRDGQIIIVAGWGLTGNSLFLPTKLQYTALRVLRQIECIEEFGDHFLDNQFCTFHSARKTCPGDSGNPAIIQRFNFIPMQVGVVSYGFTNCSSHSSSAYSLVAPFLPWIERKTDLIY